MIYIFFGLDNVGKTTQINLLREHLPPSHVLRYPSVKNHNDPMKYGLELFKQTFKIFEFSVKNNIIILCDRSYLDELLYAPIYRNYFPVELIDIIAKESQKKYWKKVKVIHLTNELNILSSREDGLSLSKNNMDKIKFESKMANAVLKYTSFIDKKNIYTVYCHGLAPNFVTQSIIQRIGL